MAIRLKVGCISLALISPLALAGIDFEISTLAGMQTRHVDLQSNHGSLRSLALYEFHKGHEDIGATLGINSAEFIELEVKAIAELYEQVSISGYTSVRVLQEYIKSGLLFNVQAPMFTQSVKIDSGLDLYLSASSVATLVNPSLDLYTNLSFFLAPSVDVFAKFRIPVLSSGTVSHKLIEGARSEYHVNMKPSYAIGIQFMFWPIDGEEIIEELIVQEPVAIVTESYPDDLPYIYDFDDEEDIDVTVSMAEKGWFAEFIEFLVRLFKF
ncbi:hypothetical protein OAT84_02305 [Gammaproteobacteria bacterium]|nr:hypothetical protein [Gammaproteobacteria bacterium]